MEVTQQHIDEFNGRGFTVFEDVIDDELGLMLIVEKLPWANTLEITRGVETALEELKQNS